MTTEELERIRGYLVAQGAKLTPAAIVDKVRAAMADLRAAAIAVPATRFTERPVPEEWSGNEVMAHVVEAGTYFGDGILSALDGRPPRRRAGRGPEDPPAQSEGRVPQRTAEAWLEILERDRAALFARVLTAEPTSHLDHTIEHPMFGPLNWRQTLLFMRLHDLDHAGQLTRIATALA